MDKNTNTKKLEEAVDGIVKGHPQISCAVESPALVVFYFDFTGDKAKQQARVCAVQWWRAIRIWLDKSIGYFEVQCTWKDVYGERFFEMVTSHNFPNLGNPNQATDQSEGLNR